MKKPYKYFIIDNTTKKTIIETNITPTTTDLTEYINGQRIQVRTAYVDERYVAKIRLYNYITYTRNGLEVPEYRPYKNTQIGKTIPILNF